MKGKGDKEDSFRGEIFWPFSIYHEAVIDCDVWEWSLTGRITDKKITN